MKQYNKLVRDKIPEIMKNQGKEFTTRVLGEEEYRVELNKKLQEEVKEYIEDNNVEELADIVQVVYGILDSMGVSREEFESVRNNKVQKRGAFKEKIFLESGD